MAPAGLASGASDCACRLDSRTKLLSRFRWSAQDAKHVRARRFDAPEERGTATGVRTAADRRATRLARGRTPQCMAHTALQGCAPLATGVSRVRTKNVYVFRARRESRARAGRALAHTRSSKQQHKGIEL